LADARVIRYAVILVGNAAFIAVFASGFVAFGRGSGKAIARL
jgi:hypothetical protein